MRREKEQNKEETLKAHQNFNYDITSTNKKLLTK